MKSKRMKRKDPTEYWKDQLSRRKVKAKGLEAEGPEAEKPTKCISFNERLPMYLYIKYTHLVAKIPRKI